MRPTNEVPKGGGTAWATAFGVDTRAALTDSAKQAAGEVAETGRSVTVPRYLIEVPHEPDKIACLTAIKVLLETGSHFLTNAEWGCGDGCHCAWMMVDVGTRDEARGILPAAYRADAKIVELSRFTLGGVNRALERYSPTS